MSADVILETEDLTKEFAGFFAVNGVSLRVMRRTIHALIGPNGAGKTTCFNMLTKFLSPTRGRIVFKGNDITALAPADVARLVVDTEDAEIVRCTVDLAHSLGLMVVAEGVEDDETWERLRDLHCDAVQGWLVAAAMPPAEATKWLLARGERGALPAAAKPLPAALPPALEAPTLPAVDRA